MNRPDRIMVFVALMFLGSLGTAFYIDLKDRRECIALGGDAVVSGTCMKLTPVKGKP